MKGPAEFHATPEPPRVTPTKLESVSTAGDDEARRRSAVPGMGDGGWDGGANGADAVVYSADPTTTRKHDIRPVSLRDAVPLPPMLRAAPVKFADAATVQEATDEPAAKRASVLPDRATAMCCHVQSTGVYDDVMEPPSAQRTAVDSSDTPS